MDEELKAALSEAVTEGVTPLAERLDALEDFAGKAREKLDLEGSGKSNEEGDVDDDAFSDAQIDQLKELIGEVVAPVAEKAERAEKRSRPGSRQPDPNDDEPVEPAMKGVDRDPFGRPIA